MHYEGYLFDLDGTLVDSLHGLHQALNLTQQQYQLPCTQADSTRPWISYGATAIIQNNCSNHHSQSELKNSFLEFYHQYVSTGSPLFPGIESMITMINHAQIPWGIVTNKNTVLAEKVIENHPILQTHHVLVCGDTLATQKPDPEPILFAAKAIHKPTDVILFVGDSIHDMHASQKAKTYSALAYYGYIDDSKAKSLWPYHHLVETSLELSKLIQAKCHPRLPPN